MKFVLGALAAVAMPGAALAQDHGGHAAHGAAAAPAPAPVTGAGVVKKIDARGGVVTIDHGPIKALNWGAMTMPFKVADASLLSGLKVGAKVSFQLQGQKIVSIRPI